MKYPFRGAHLLRGTNSQQKGPQASRRLSHRPDEKEHPQQRHPYLIRCFPGWGGGAWAHVGEGRSNAKKHTLVLRPERPEPHGPAAGPAGAPGSPAGRTSLDEEPPPGPRAPTTTARRSDLRAGTDTSPHAGVAVGPDTPTPPGRRALTCGGRGSSDTALRQVRGRGPARGRRSLPGPRHPPRARRPSSAGANRPQPSGRYSSPRI